MSNVQKFDRRWFMIDMARHYTFSRKEYTIMLDMLQNLGYNGIGMYFEGAFEFKSIPGVSREKVMTFDDAAWFVEECKKRGIYAFPMTNIAGHMNHFYLQERNRELFSNGIPFQLDFKHEKAKDFVMTYIRDYIEAFGADMINVGGDEVTLENDEEKVAYAKFVGEICEEIHKMGIKTSIWGDMFFHNPDLCEYISRDTMIFAWCYHGHLPEYLQLFVDEGFKEVFACNCDNGWIGLINQQHGPYKRPDLGTDPYEVEAFLADAKNIGIPNGLVTDWENYLGRNLWGQLAPIARCALFMKGEVEALQCKDDQIDMALFGRITGYAEVTRILQDGLQPADIPRLSPPWDIMFSLRTALYEQTFFDKIVKQLIEENPTYFDKYDETIEKAEEILDKWIPESQLEELALTSMYKITAMSRAVNGMIKIVKGYHKYYAKAAKMQFVNKNIASQYLNRFESVVRHCCEEFRTYRNIHATATEYTGYSMNDVVKLNEMIERITKMADYLCQFNSVIDRIPLPRIEAILAQSMIDKFHDWGLVRK